LGIRNPHLARRLDFPRESQLDTWHQRIESSLMLHYALVFLVVALIAAVLGFSGIAGTAAWIAKICFVVFLVLAIISFLKKAK
jgi:uncharacterized membrane protein YtjA (UPF0391 family)